MDPLNAIGNGQASSNIDQIVREACVNKEARTIVATETDSQVKAAAMKILEVNLAVGKATENVVQSTRELVIQQMNSQQEAELLGALTAPAILNIEATCNLPKRAR